MPKSAKKPCGYPGCPELVSSGRCPKHKIANQRDNSCYRDPLVVALYNSSRWKGMRRLQLIAFPWCAACLTVSIYAAATTADHVVPHRGDPELFYNGELQSLCFSCHSRKTAGETLHKTEGRGGEKLSGRGDTAQGWRRREKISQQEDSG